MPDRPQAKKYRVTWKEFNDPRAGFPGHPDCSMTEFVRDFTDIDQGYDFYQDLDKASSHAYEVTWEHIWE